MEEPLFYTDKNFLPSHHDGVSYGFFTRKGGYSEGTLASLNCGVGTSDSPKISTKNRTIVAKKIGVPYENLISLYQVHGNICHTVDVPWLLENRPQGDAFVTDIPGIALGILTADCAPVLFYGEKQDASPVIGAAHAGWKGALAGVLKETMQTMVQKGVIENTIKACVGPCIGRASYEVSSDFVEPFLEFHDESVRFFHPAREEGKLLFDLPGYCAWQLFQAGVRNITLMDKDTYTNEEEFYSYRRMTHRGEKEYGRQISVIAIKEKK